MRIGIDARMIDWGGVGRYTANLLRAFMDMSAEGSLRHEIVLFHLPGAEESLPDGHPFELRQVKQPVFSMPGQLGWARALGDAKLDLFHSPHFPVPLLYRGAMVVTIHDVIPLASPESMSSSAASMYFRTMARVASRRSRSLITVSEASKAQIVSRLGVPADKVEVIYEAADPIYHPVAAASARSAVRQRFGIDGSYILYVGAQKPHKNLPGLIRAYADLEPAVRALYPLVIAGKEDPRFPEPAEAARKNKVRKSVHFLGQVEDDVMPALYSAARMLAYPSFFEGFGFPPLEAMACGAPVLSSNVSCLPEILGEAALLVDPGDHAGMTAAMTRLLTDDALRAQMMAAGTERAKMYSWGRAARETVAVYDEVLGSTQ